MNQRIKYYTDENVDLAVVAGLRRRGIDVISAQEAKLLSIEDLVHLEFALNQGRVIITHDADFLRLHANHVKHAGIVYAPQYTPIGTIIRRLLLIAQILESADMVDHVEFI